MSIQKNVLLTLTLLAVTLTLAQSCRFLPGYLCSPDQYYCSRRGGKCSVVGGRCACVPVHQFYGYQPGYGPSYQDPSYDPPSYEAPPNGYAYSRYGYRRRPYIEPDSSLHPMSESNMERNTNFMVHMAQMHRMMNRIMT